MKLSIKDQIKAASLDELEARYELYSNLQSRGVRDELILTLLEQEIAQRELAEINGEYEIEYHY